MAEERCALPRLYVAASEKFAGVRILLVFFCTFLSSVGAQDLDKFVAFVGSFACVPLCYVYPAMLHYKACAHTRRQKIIDIALMVFGSIAAVYTTAQTITVCSDRLQPILARNSFFAAHACARRRQSKVRVLQLRLKRIDGLDCIIIRTPIHVIHVITTFPPCDLTAAAL